MKTRRQFLGSGIAVVLSALLAPLLNCFKTSPKQVGWITLRSPDTKVRRMLRMYQDTEKRFLTQVDGKFLFVNDLYKSKLVLSSDAYLEEVMSFSYPCDWEWEAKLSA